MPANLTYTDGDYSSAFAVSPLITQPAFDGVNTHYVGTQRWVQARANYSPLALDTAHPDSASFLLVKESEFEDLGGGIQEWTRTYAAIPSQRIEGRSLAWELPGLGMGGANAVTPITGVAGLGSDPNTVVTVTTASAHGLSADDTVYLALETDFNRYRQQNYTLVKLLSASGSSFTVYQGILGQFRAISVQKAGNARQPETKTVPAKVVFDYYKESNINNITILQPEVIRNSAGLVTDTYDLGTTPTLSAYQAKIAAGDWIVAQASVTRRWMGNIYERETIYVKAQ